MSTDPRPSWLLDAKLKVELVPQTSWGNNLRSLLRRKDWDNLRREAYMKAGHVCEICGGKGRKHPVECHEIWEYDDDAKIQKLTGLIALCPACHRCKHPGMAARIGLIANVFAQLEKVNGWTWDQARVSLELAFELHRLRSTVPWTVDTDWLGLDEQGVTLLRMGTSGE